MVQAVKVRIDQNNSIAGIYAIPQTTGKTLEDKLHGYMQKMKEGS